MVFKRRDRRPIWKIVLEFFWPRGGWARAARYVKHRLHRLPDPPHRIARGIFAGVFTTFTPFYGLHFLVAGLLAWIMRGNIIAALLATFFGNPLTYVPIGVVSLKTGYFLLGLRPDTAATDEMHTSLGRMFVDAAADLKANLAALFTDDVADWSRLSVFYDEVFFPYMIGGIIPGVVVGLICYYVSVPLIRAYQNRRRGAIKAKLAALRKKTHLAGDDSKKGD
ncbi:DUF2062 domain-containing protein [Lutimaribacter sp. EGI FJ00015]|uniref:DUF2062 domain-containing protein n=1 Tax=Lutimaribacter degradans TaxID=2945989 RepID=A0ACC5ZZ40_9RHOB|nr:DUF2062 domain-containing protein [Lutimaribacter sp. EGI FJ00013]MCO0613776.1 DUF2062 domain-containing protein [Lutimaribacter sp. EGI FJ00015]MCO0636741.1 DUF2062 domain-containing protein [Lutimaribacter sp. EGI FJ00014]